MKYVVIYERGVENWGAFAPDLPGYGATAESLEALRALVREEIPFHMRGYGRLMRPSRNLERSSTRKKLLDFDDQTARGDAMRDLTARVRARE